MIDLSGIKLPFSINDVVIAGMDFLAVIAPYVILVLAFWFVRNLINLIKDIKENKEEWVEHNKHNRFGRYINRRF